MTKVRSTFLELLSPITAWLFDVFHTRTHGLRDVAGAHPYPFGSQVPPPAVLPNILLLNSNETFLRDTGIMITKTP